MQSESKNAVTIAVIMALAWAFSYYVLYFLDYYITFYAEGDHKPEVLAFFTEIKEFFFFFILAAFIEAACIYAISNPYLHVKNLTYPLIITCYISLAVHMAGSLSHLSKWYGFSYDIFLNGAYAHYYSLIAITSIQVLIFFTYGMREIVSLINRHTSHYRDRYFGGIASVRMEEND